MQNSTGGHLKLPTLCRCLSSKRCGVVLLLFSYLVTAAHFLHDLMRHLHVRLSSCQKIAYRLLQLAASQLKRVVFPLGV